MLSLKNKMLMTAAVFAVSLSIGAMSVSSAKAQDDVTVDAVVEETVVETQDAAPAAAAAAAAAVVTDEKLSLFAVAQKSIVDIQQQYQAKASEAKTPEDIAKLQEGLNNDVLQAIQAAGLTSEEFSGIAQAIQGDAQLAEKYKAIAGQ